MSRTYRRKVPNNKQFKWILHDWSSSNTCNGPLPLLDPRSKIVKKKLARFHADQTMFKEPGPAWFRRMFVERPQRRHATMQLHRIVQGEEFELMLEAKNPLMYWL